MVGGGVFVSPALTLAMVGSGGMNIVIWLFASFITLTGVCTYAELGTMVRELLTRLETTFISLLKHIARSVKQSFLEGKL